MTMMILTSRWQSANGSIQGTRWWYSIIVCLFSKSFEDNCVKRVSKLSEDHRLWILSRPPGNVIGGAVIHTQANVGNISSSRITVPTLRGTISISAIIKIFS